jgi:hypothetical protein
MSPWDEGFKRAAWNALATFLGMFVLTFFVQWQQLLGDVASDLSDSEKLRNALVAGVIAGLGPLVGGSLWARGDQSRADKGIVKPYDVPIQILARQRKTSPAMAVGDFPSMAA